MSHMLLSLMTTISASRSASACVSRKSGRCLEPTSSSPSTMTVMRQGGPPCVSCQKRSASSHIIACPLSSTAPRATTRLPCGPSTITGSKGGLVHNSIGSAGCTS